MTRSNPSSFAAGDMFPVIFNRRKPLPCPQPSPTNAHATSGQLRLATRLVTGVNPQPEFARDNMNRAPAVQTPEKFSPLRLALQVLLSPKSIDHNTSSIIGCRDDAGNSSRLTLCDVGQPKFVELAGGEVSPR